MSLSKKNKKWKYRRDDIIENIQRAKEIIERDIHKPSVIFISANSKIAYQQLTAIFEKSKYVLNKIRKIL